MDDELERTPKVTEEARGVSPKLIFGGVIAVLALILVFQNTRDSRVDALFWTWTMPLWIWLLVLFAAGLLVGSIFPWLRPRKKKE
ncbi:LapA family protein [Nocardioides marmoriginsengisoli]|uniref:LapA family protein n=1 Tax=Nocardioides marmoriginsengisoli TaxID=661483 RepID=A0A3N0CF53_9ACTN|nr:LapA family protein [Nocardioides marmoriginsengisoli]RNL62087.1 LapA family protein [Nocardioides marmoriginsengisoli]